MGDNILLMVPVQLDALFVETERMVVGASADFTKLPYIYDGVDINPNNAHISEEIISQPFQNTDLLLAKGVHLHWSLPDKLTNGIQKDGEATTFPDVPNRWIVRKCVDGKEVNKWIVISDYLWPVGEGEGRVCVPYIPDPIPEDGNYVPFRYLGHVIPFANYSDELECPAYDNLNVLGYGEPTFTAFYPNCHSVFGFHDADVLSQEDLNKVTYEVIGFYKDLNQDFLASEIGGYETVQEKWDHIYNELDWSPNDLEKDAGGTIIYPDLPNEMICYSKVDFEITNAVGSINSNIKDTSAEVSLGITGIEALSAYLGQTIAEQDDVTSNKIAIEEQMEALMMGLTIGKELDTGPRFIQDRHDKEFVATESPQHWIIKKEGDVLIKDEETNAHWDSARSLLSEVNEINKEYSRNLTEIKSLQEQLYADWYKYMICAYPPENAYDSVMDVDEVKYFVEKGGLEPLEDRIALIGTLISDESGDVPTYSANQTESLAATLADKLNELQTELTELNSKIVTLVSEQNLTLTEAQQVTTPVFYLSKKPGPRYWKPKDPVVLVKGDALEPSKRFGKDGSDHADGKLICEIIKDTDSIENIITSKNLDVVYDAITAVAQKAGEEDHPALNHWSDQPWNPLTLEWKVQFFPVENEGNITHDAMDFKETFITNNFELLENQPDVSLKSMVSGFVPSASIYSGSSILSAHASGQMTDTFKDYVKKNVLNDCLINVDEGKGYFEAKDITSSDDYLDEVANIDLVYNWYVQVKTEASLRSDDLSYICLKALIETTKENFHCLSQSLGGFNDSLLMIKRSLELKVKDPLAFPEYQSFSNAVGEMLGSTSELKAPLPQNDFNPLRSGKMSITELRIVDSFGQEIDLNLDEGLITSENMTAPDHLNQAMLRPRILQSAQVHFRWLSSNDDIESNEMKYNSPICGWVMTNNLDNSLMIFEASGLAIGAFTSSDHDWKPAPGYNEEWVRQNDNGDLEFEADKGNAHLQKMMEYFHARNIEKDEGENYINGLDSFLDAINTSTENINPDTFGQHKSMAQLIGRPLALVRASLDIVLQEPAAIHQGWEIFAQDMERKVRESNQFAQVKFPIRIGEYNQNNDGVVGYWVEDDIGEYVDETFYAPAANVLETNYIRTHADEAGELLDSSHEGHEAVNQFQTIENEAMEIDLLFDPRGKVNLTTGLLPSKTIDIPANLYIEAMDQIEVYFVSSPHIVDPDGLKFNLPPEQGFKWSFLRNTADGITEEDLKRYVPAPTLFTGEKSILDGWLKLEKTSDTEEDIQNI